MFEERGVKLLDDNGLFQMGGKKVPWVELVARSPAPFRADDPELWQCVRPKLCAANF